MKRLLRHIHSGEWVTPSGRLTQDLRAALETETLSEALEFCKAYHLKGVEVVLRFGDPRYDSTIQISDTLFLKRPISSD